MITDDIEMVAQADLSRETDFEKLANIFNEKRQLKSNPNEIFGVYKSKDSPRVIFLGGSVNELIIKLITDKNELIRITNWLSEKIPETVEWGTPTICSIPVKIDLGKNIHIKEIAEHIPRKEVTNLEDKPDNIYTNPSGEFQGIYYTENGIAHIAESGIIQIVVNPDEGQIEIDEEEVEEKVELVKEQVEEKIDDERSNLVAKRM